MIHLRQINLRPTQQNHVYFKIARAKAFKTINQGKLASWRQYVSRLNSRSSVKRTWYMIRKIKGKGGSFSVNHLNTSDSITTSKKDIANTLADSFVHKSSSSNYSPKFPKF